MKLTQSSLGILAVIFAWCAEGTTGKIARSLSEQDTQRIKKDNILKDDARLQVEFISAENPSVRVSGRDINLDALEEYSVRASGFRATVDDEVLQNPPRSQMYRGTVDGASVFFVKDDQNRAEFLHVRDRSLEFSMVPVGDEDGKMVVIRSDDYDVEKMKMHKMFHNGEFAHGGVGEEGTDGAVIDPNFDYDNARYVAPDPARSCVPDRTIELSVMFDSSFCLGYGGGDGSGAVAQVETIVGMASQLYEVAGLCTKVQISRIEGYCDPNTDIWRFVIDNEFLPGIFESWMNDNRQDTPRDAAHFFSGTPFTFGGGGYIGYASLNTVCDIESAYALNYVLFNTNPTLQSVLIAHELGHNSGANHYSPPGYIMNPGITDAPNGFSMNSIDDMNAYLDEQTCLSPVPQAPPTPISPPSPTPPVPAPATSAPVQPPKKKGKSRRRLQATASKSFNPGDETYRAYLKACGHFEYTLFLHINQESHLLVYGVPPDQAVETGCPFGAAHVIFVSRDGKPVKEKEILMWNGVQDGLSMFEEEESLPIGTFKLADLAEAYEATPDDDTVSSGMYDIVTNNCATYMVKLASTLGVKIDTRITLFVARRLLEESGKDLADMVRNSVHYLPFFGNLRSHLRPSSIGAANELTDHEIVEILVGNSASGLFTKDD